MLVSALLTGCTGLKLAESPINRSLPESFTKRALYPAGVAAYEFQDLVGNILRIKNDEDPIRIGLIRPNGFVTVVEPITDPLNYYKSRIQQGAEAQGSYLAFAANFKADQLAELELIDIARSGVAFNTDVIFNQITTQATAWVNQHPNSDSAVTRLWIKSVVLTRRIYNDYTKINVNASGVVGGAVGVSTGVYNNSEQSIQSVIIAFEAFDIDQLVEQLSVKDTLKSLFPKSIERLADLSIYSGTIQGKIK